MFCVRSLKIQTPKFDGWPFVEPVIAKDEIFFCFLCRFSNVVQRLLARRASIASFNFSGGQSPSSPSPPSQAGCDLRTVAAANRAGSPSGELQRFDLTCT